MFMVDLQSYHNTEIIIQLLEVFFHRLKLAFGPVRKGFHRNFSYYYT